MKSDFALLANIKKINDWRAANKTKAAVICAPALDRDGLVPNWLDYRDEQFLENMVKTTKPFLKKQKVVYLGNVM